MNCKIIYLQIIVHFHPYAIHLDQLVQNQRVFQYSLNWFYKYGTHVEAWYLCLYRFNPSLQQSWNILSCLIFLHQLFCLIMIYTVFGVCSLHGIGMLQETAAKNECQYYCLYDCNICLTFIAFENLSRLIMILTFQYSLQRQMYYSWPLIAGTPKMTQKLL